MSDVEKEKYEAEISELKLILSTKDKEIEEMKAKNEEMIAEKKYMDESVKALTKRNKQLEIQVA